MDESKKPHKNSEPSLHSAKENGDSAEAARSALALFRIISERQPPEVVSSLLAEVRRLTTRAAYYTLPHSYTSRWPVKKRRVGSLEQARRHLRIAFSLLDMHPNAWLLQLCEINAFCIEFFNSDLRSAEEHLERAKRSGAISGASESTVLNNLAHLYLETASLVKLNGF